MNTTTPRGSLVWVSSVVVVCLCFAAYFATAMLQSKGLWRASVIQIKMLWEGWLEAGRPAGAQLDAFMLGRGDDVCVSNITLTIEGKIFHGHFALLRLKTGQEGTLIISTNGEIALFRPNRQPQRVSQ